MDDKQKNSSSTVYEINDSIMTFVSTWAGIIAAVVGMVTIFFIASIQPDGSLDIRQTLSSHIYWVLTSITVTVGVTVAIINYRSTRQKERESPEFIETRIEYKKAKDNVADDFDLIPDFCADKTIQLRESLVRDNVEEAAVKWSVYEKHKRSLPLLLENENLEDWQIKKLKHANKVHVKSLRAKDLLQDDTTNRNARKSYLGSDERALERRFIRGTFATRLFAIMATNLVFGIGLILTNWVTGLANALGVLLALVGAIIAGVEDTRGPIRARYITKTDLLVEFKVVKHTYRKVDKEKELL